ncbi:hypothetical protein VE03_09823 [Pseudogymnoascus sp. 23342-1-I1]|nr:hypothetical protein VE03_09823 [Pseudogymnoascus sp. 23342-1-I1]
MAFAKSTSIALGTLPSLAPDASDLSVNSVPYTTMLIQAYLSLHTQLLFDIQEGSKDHHQVTSKQLRQSGESKFGKPNGTSPEAIALHLFLPGTHRERKEIYIKSLETEVLQLRTNEANLLQETRSLYGEIDQLKKVLTELGVQLPLEGANAAPVDHESAAFPSNSVVGIRQGSKGPQIHVGHSAVDRRRRNDGFHLSANPPADGIQHVFHEENGQASDVTSSFQSPSSGGVPSSSNAYGSAQSVSSPESTAGLDMESIGIEFVLTLESPCLGHIQGGPDDPEAPSGHVLTASAPLLFRAPSIATGPHICTTTPWEAPSSGLERLLNLSQGLVLDGEVTPVQAWNYIRQRLGPQGVEVEKLRELTEKLLKEVSCHGFGAVVEQGTFEGLVFDVLVVGQGF